MPGHASHAVQDIMLLLLMLEGVQHTRRKKQRKRKRGLQTWQQKPLPSRHTGVIWLRYQHHLLLSQADMTFLHH